MSKYSDVVALRKKILVCLKQEKTLVELQSDGILMTSDFWLTQEKIEEEFETETWHYLLIVDFQTLVTYLKLDLSKDEELIMEFT